MGRMGRVGSPPPPSSGCITRRPNLTGGSRQRANSPVAPPAFPPPRVSRAELFKWRSAGPEVRVVREDGFVDHLNEIIEYELGEARVSMEKNHDSSLGGERALFEALLAMTIKRVRARASDDLEGAIRLFRHYIFMIREAAKNHGSYFTGAVILIHNVEDNTQITAAVKEVDSRLADLAQEAIKSRDRFRHLDGLRYLPPPGKHRQFVPDFMINILCASEGDGHALLIRLVHRLSSIAVGNDLAKEKVKSTHDVYARLAERIGLDKLARKLDDFALQAAEPDEYARIELAIMQALQLSRRSRASAWLEEAMRGLTGTTAEILGLDSEVVGYYYRVKGTWATGRKEAIKVNGPVQPGKSHYDGIAQFPDLAAGTVVTPKPFHLDFSRRSQRDALQTAMGIVARYFGDNLIEIIDRDAAGNEQTLAKTLYVKYGQQKVPTYIVYYVVARVRTHEHKTRTIEIQFMDRETYHAWTNVLDPHWSYTAEKLTGGKFDQKELMDCGQLMTGDFFRDVKILYDFYRKRWVSIMYRVKERHVSDDEVAPIRVLKRRRDATPIDAAAAVLSDIDLWHFSGVKTTKAWKPRKPVLKAKDKLFDPGDLVEFVFTEHPREHMALMGEATYAKHLQTKYRIFTLGPLDIRNLIREGTKFMKPALKTSMPAVTTRDGLLEAVKKYLKQEFGDSYDEDKLERLAAAESLSLNELLTAFVLGKSGQTLFANVENLIAEELRIVA